MTDAQGEPEVADYTDVDVVEQLTDLVAKIDSEGLDYFLMEYGGPDMVPDIAVSPADPSIKSLAIAARDALNRFDNHLHSVCQKHGVEYEQ